MLDKLMNLAIPPWARVAIPVAIVLVIFGAGFWFKGVLVGAEIARKDGKIATLEYAVQDRNETITALVAAAEATIETLATNEAAKLKAEAELAEYRARPPKTITRWRTAAAGVPEAIPADAPCAVQVHRGIDLLQRALAEREGR